MSCNAGLIPYCRRVSSRDGGDSDIDRMVTPLHDQFKWITSHPATALGNLHSPRSERLSVIDISMPALAPPCL
jgi:hypothetical protein